MVYAWLALTIFKCDIPLYVWKMWTGRINNLVHILDTQQVVALKSC